MDIWHTAPKQSKHATVFSNCIQQNGVWKAYREPRSNTFHWLCQDPVTGTIFDMIVEKLTENLLPSCSVEHAGAKGKQHRNIEPPVREAHVYEDFLQSIHYTEAKAVSAYG